MIQNSFSVHGNRLSVRYLIPEKQKFHDLGSFTSLIKIKSNSFCLTMDRSVSRELFESPP